MTPPTSEHSDLRSALEFAVEVARASQKLRPQPPVPSAIKRFVAMARIPTGALGQLRRLVEADTAFRERVAAAATPELVDEIGLLWLQRPLGWEQQIDDLATAAKAADDERNVEAELRRERKRRAAAEKRAVDARTEKAVLEERLAALSSELDDTRAVVIKLEELTAELRTELVDTRNEVRHANDRAAAAGRKVEQLAVELAAAQEKRGAAEEVRDDVLADRARAGLDAARIVELGRVAKTLADDLASLVEADDPVAGGERTSETRPERRRPLSLPGGVIGDSDRATEHLVRSGSSILVDGYNVAKLGWPGLDLARQRVALLDAAEAMARRYGADLTVVFDGSDVVGASTDQRRLVRVTFSRAGITADDVIRAEVDRLPATRQVVVVTNDAEIVRDVKNKGANVVSSDRFLALARR